MRHVFRIALDTLLTAFIVWRIVVIVRDAYYAWRASEEMRETIHAAGEAMRAMAEGHG